MLRSQQLGSPHSQWIEQQQQLQSDDDDNAMRWHQRSMYRFSLILHPTDSKNMDIELPTKQQLQQQQQQQQQKNNGLDPAVAAAAMMQSTARNGRRRAAATGFWTIHARISTRSSKQLFK